MPKRRSKGFANPAQTWDARFAGSDYIFGTEPNEWMARHRDLIAAGGRVLAVADGEGRNSVWLAQQGLRVDAFDISAVGVEKARKLADSIDLLGTAGAPVLKRAIPAALILAAVVGIIWLIARRRG